MGRGVGSEPSCSADAHFIPQASHTFSRLRFQKPLYLRTVSSQSLEKLRALPLGSCFTGQVAKHFHKTQFQRKFIYVWGEGV